MKLWQMWFIIFYVTSSHVVSHEYLIGLGFGSFIAAVIFGLLKQ